ncbi:MAG: efflux RND transporter periplasmic adaptor subunit, partial [Planctomycetota bacterium]
KLKVKLSQLELDMFIDEENGSYRLEVEEIRRQIDDVNNEILSSQASMELKRDDAAGVQQLFKLGYAGKNELRRSELAYLQAEGQYAAKINKLETNLASLRKKENYERRMQMMKLEGALKTAERSAEQVKVNNQAKLAQMNAILRARTEQLKKEEERLTRYQTQLKACKVFAPQDGMVAYAVGRTGPIEEGIPVRFRQHMLSLPALNKMQVRTSVHESVLDQMQPGLVVSVGVDAFPDRRYTGLVQSVAVLPDQSGFLGRDTKVYETVITIDGEVESLKPGMTAVTEIHIDQIDNVVTVPVQAVIENEGKTFCVVKSGPQVRLAEVTLGKANDVAVSVVKGLMDGDTVALNPTELSDILQDEAS